MAGKPPFGGTPSLSAYEVLCSTFKATRDILKGALLPCYLLIPCALSQEMQLNNKA